MEHLTSFLKSFSGFLWGGPLMVLLLGIHAYFTVKLRFIQKWIPRGIRLSFSPSSDSQSKQISPYKALSTALAATIGTGNIIGISTAIALGGPGAIFWCWMTGFLGIATCYGECYLSMGARRKTSQGTVIGGPMYVMQSHRSQFRRFSIRNSSVSSKSVLGIFFAITTILASFGVGSSVQSHSICSAVTRHLHLSPSLIGVATAVLAGFVILGGVGQISKICAFLVPFMSIFYLAGCLWILVLNRSFLLPGLTWILRDAFSGKAAAGGMFGGSLLTCLRIGISRGLFTNEAGQGSIPIAAAASDCDSPTVQSLVSMTGPFWDTVVICAITGLVIASSILKTPGLYHNIAPDELCFTAFSQLPFYGEEILSISLALFAFATILGWCYYGEAGMQFLFGTRGKSVYQILYLLFVYLGAVISLDLVWSVSDLMNACMALPNLFCLWTLRKEISPP